MKYNFTFSGTPLRAISWVQDSDGNDYGAVYDVHHRFADLGPFPGTITYERAQSVEFLPFIWTARGVLGTRLPKEVPKYTTLFKPFDLSAWTVFLVFVGFEIVLGLILELNQTGKVGLCDMGEHLVKSATVSLKVIFSRRIPKSLLRYAQ